MSQHYSVTNTDTTAAASAVSSSTRDSSDDEDRSIIEIDDDDDEDGDVEDDDSDIVEIIEQREADINRDQPSPAPRAKHTRKMEKKKTKINEFFKPLNPKKKPVGRPRKRKKRQHTHSSSDDIPIEQRKRPPEELLSETAAAVLPPPPPSNAKKTRINWGKPGPDRDKMERAIDHWLNEGEDRFDFNGERIDDYVVYANYCDIPVNSLYRYIHPDASKRHKLGDGSRGKDKLLTDEEVRFVGQVLARQDRANDPYGRKQAKDIIMDVAEKELKPKAASQILTRRVIPMNASEGILKSNLQKPQATTSDRTNINIAQQYRWHRLVDTEYNNLRIQTLGYAKRVGSHLEKS